MVRRALVLIVLIVVFCSRTNAQMISIPMSVASDSGGLRTLTFGADPFANYCVTDTMFGEWEMPPVPITGVFDARFVDPRGFSLDCFGQGTNRDFRHLAAETQVDTYMITLQPDEAGFPIHFTWQAPLEYSEAWLRDPFDGSLVNVDMKTTPNYSLTLPLTSLLIVTSTALDSLPPPPVTVTSAPGPISQNSALLRGRANPNGYTTLAWFEWGTSTAYGFTTQPQFIGSGTESVLVEHLLDLILNPETEYHYRLVARTSSIPAYGSDYSFTTIGNGWIGETIVPLIVTDNGGESSTIWFGVHPNASYCVDPHLGEFFLPPPPPAGSFDVRLIDPRGPLGSCLDAGVMVDLRTYIDTDQLDSARIRLQPGPDGYPVTLHWPELSWYFTSPVKLVDAYGGLAVDVDMQTQGGLTLSDPAIADLLVIAGPIPPTPMPPSVMTSPAEFVTGVSAQLRGFARPNGFATTCWFEWGTTISLGNSTPVQNLGAGSTTIAVAQSLVGLAQGTTHYYRIAGQNQNGIIVGPTRSFTTSGTTDIGEEDMLPTSTVVHQNYPNPFNPSTTLSFDIQHSAFVILKVFDILGREVATLVNERKEPGTHRVEFNAEGLPSGIYVYRLQGDAYSQSKKMLLLR